MSWLRSLSITAIIGTGIGIVMWLVSLITGETGAWMSGVLATCFAMLWFWIHRGMNDPELQPKHNSH